MDASLIRLGSVGAWRSLVARLLWEQDVAGSNPVAPTNHTTQLLAPYSCALLFGGELTVRSAPAVGTKVKARIPDAILS